MKNHFVHTPCGPVQGAAGGADGVSVFRGIRYATAGRWEYPRQVTHWDGVYDAANFGACSFQPRAFYNEEDVPEKAFYYNGLVQKGRCCRHHQLPSGPYGLFVPAGACRPGRAYGQLRNV